MAYSFGNNMNNSSLPPAQPMMAGMPMLGGQNFDNLHNNYSMNHPMMMPGMNDAPLEFNMNKNLPTMDNGKGLKDIGQRRPMDNVEQNNEINSQPMQNNDLRGSGNIRRQGHNIRGVSRRRDRRDHNDDKDRRDRGQDRGRSGYKGRFSEEHSNGRSKSNSDNRVPEDMVTESLQGNGLNSQQGMMFSGMGMGNMFGGNIMNASMGMVGGMGGMMMDPGMMSMGQYTMMPAQIDNASLAEANPINPIPINAPANVSMVGNEGLPMTAPADLQMSLPNTMGNMLGIGFPMGAVKETLQFKSCTLVPPYPSSAPPTTRELPPGCRTVFVGGLPENITEEIITEIFEKCGEITSLRLSKKSFCHIRFAYEQSVDGAVFLSGYRIRIDNKTDAANSGRLHVDYAQARDDQHEWECKQRALQREARHRERMAVRHRPPSPPPIHHYTDHEATAICDKIKQDENFAQAVQVIITWLERGDCNKRNVNVFYSMVQSTNSHVRRLLNEKTQYEEELLRAKEEAKVKMQGILIQFSQVEKVFAAASHKKVWDHFTKAQRKNIDMWKKQSSEIRIVQLEDFLQETGGGEEMDVSDADDSEPGGTRKRPKLDGEQLKEENDSLKCQLEAYKNEIDILKSETQVEIESKSQSIQQLQSRLAVLESQLAHAKRSQASESVKLLAMEAKYHAKEKSEADKKQEIDNDNKDSCKSDLTKCEQKASGNVADALSDKEAKLIGIMSTFLHVHPFGASTDYLWSYVQKMEPQLRPNQMEDLLRRFPTLFLQEISGVGANIERKWVFNGFNKTC